MYKNNKITTKNKLSVEQAAEKFVSGDTPPSPSKSERQQELDHTPESGQKSVKRLTLDLPASLHRRIKLKAVEQETTMLDLITRILETNL